MEIGSELEASCPAMRKKSRAKPSAPCAEVGSSRKYKGSLLRPTQNSIWPCMSGTNVHGLHKFLAASAESDMVFRANMEPDRLA